MTLVPGDVNKLVRLGRVQLKTGHPEDTRATFSKALALPHDSSIENNVAYDLCC